ncbi:helix-turn-helix domain-containing protein [Isoptericola variabilis]|uniref:helix-turn-helix domain-containing protein n=1 Tax=Isoptericola variabilis TaxID=139208 RepID=UPI003D24AA18
MDTNETQVDALTSALADTLTAERSAARLTRGELAKRAGLSEVALGRYERGERDVPYKTLAQLAGALGYKPSELMAAAEARAERRS